MPSTSPVWLPSYLVTCVTNSLQLILSLLHSWIASVCMICCFHWFALPLKVLQVQVDNADIWRKSLLHCMMFKTFLGLIPAYPFDFISPDILIYILCLVTLHYFQFQQHISLSHASLPSPLCTGKPLSSPNNLCSLLTMKYHMPHCHCFPSATLPQQSLWGQKLDLFNPLFNFSMQSNTLKMLNNLSKQIRS